MNKKIRLDKLLLDRNLAPTREKAQFLIMSGNVLVNDKKIDKSGQLVSSTSSIRLLKELSQYVSRGANKIDGILQNWNIPIQDRTILDVGISTGGFTDYLLQHGAKSSIGIDVGYGQLDNKLRQDPRVLNIERTNARLLTSKSLDDQICKNPQPELFKNPDLVVMDLSFISVTKVLPIIAEIVSKDSDFVVLIKPQFESQKSEIGKGGIIKDDMLRQEILNRTLAQLSTKFISLNTCLSPLTGTKGNQEFWAHLQIKKS